MENRIQRVQVHDHRLSPAEAEAWITVVPAQRKPTLEVRGRLMGPRCAYTSTVEVAYPLRPSLRAYDPEEIPRLSTRVVIPEPSWWDLECPFLYQGPVELWDGSKCLDQIQVSHGFRVLQLTPQGLWLNGRPLRVRGVACDQCSEEEARRLHQSGCNTLLIPMGDPSAGLWDIADWLGFLVLGRLTSKGDLPRAQTLSAHPSCLGWLLAPEFGRDLPVIAILSAHPTAQGQLLGAQLDQRPVEPPPAGVSLVACTEELLPELADMHLPKIVLRHPRAGENSEPTWAATPGILGWIDLSS
jgi:hypothetical protein